MPRLKIRAAEALSPSAAGLSRPSDVVGIHLLKVSGEWVSLSDELIPTSNRSPLETSPSTFYGRGKHRASTASKPRRIGFGETKPSTSASKQGRKVLGNSSLPSSTANKSRGKVLGDRRQSLPSSTANKSRGKVLGDRRQSLPHTVDRMPVPLLKCKSENLFSRAKRVRRKLPPLRGVVADRFTQQSIRSWLSIKSKPAPPSDENKPEPGTDMGQKFARPYDGGARVDSPASDGDRFLPKAASSPADDADDKSNLYSRSRKRICFETVAADLRPSDVSVDPPRPERETEDTCDGVDVDVRDADVTAVPSPTQVNDPAVKLEASGMQDAAWEERQAVNVSEKLTKPSSIVHKSLTVGAEDVSSPMSPSRVSVGSILVNEEISLGGSTCFNVNRHVMDLDTSGNVARGLRHRDITSRDTSGNVAHGLSNGNRPRNVCKRKAQVLSEETNKQHAADVNLVYEQNLYQDLEGVPMVVLQKMSKAVLLKYYNIIVDH